MPGQADDAYTPTMDTTPPPTLGLPASAAGRRLVPEVMDDPSLDPELHESALRGLGRINRVSRSAGMLWPRIRAAARCRPGGVLRVMDLACGGGDVLIQLAKRSQRSGFDIQFQGIDVSPVALKFARQQAQAGGVAETIRFVEHDVLSEALPEACDVAMNSLFMHHLTAEQATAVLSKMKREADTVLINDLRRGAVAQVAAVLASRLLSRSPVVHVDGPRSVRAAWTPPEILALAERAGLHGATVRRRFPWRMLLEWQRGSANGTGHMGSSS